MSLSKEARIRPYLRSYLLILVTACGIRGLPESLRALSNG